MKIRLVKKRTLESYAQHHPFSRVALKNWWLKVQYADWDRPADIQKLFPSADLLGNGSDRVVFNINGNNYRLICKYWFDITKVHLYIKWIGTHALYTQLCKQGLQYTVDDF